MTDSEFEGLGDFSKFPIYEQDDANAKQLERPTPDDIYTGSIFAVSTVQEADLFRGALSEPRGAVRYWYDGKSSIYVLFWCRRPSSPLVAQE